MKSVVLVILDGWGLSPIEEGNAPLFAKTPFLLKLLGSYPKTTLSASGEAVGLPFGEMGNSEVGHLNLGTGRVIIQNLPRIDKAISSGSFFKNEALLSAISHVKKNNSALHLLGLVSTGGVHSHLNHLLALLKLLSLQKVKNFYLHMITDGRDTPPKTAFSYLNKLKEKGRIASVSGRYYAMDRDKHWDRTELAYKILVEGRSEGTESAEEAVQKAYQRNETDEFIKPTFIKGGLPINSNDALIFFNFRPDRARQLTSALISPQFNGFKGKKVLKNLLFVSFTSYGEEPSSLCRIAFFAEKVEKPLASIFEKEKLSQFHLAETEKYPHVTYFFNGGLEKPFLKEERILIPSLKVATYNLKPEMKAFEIVQKAISKIKNHHFTIINFANPDMVGHTGDFKATVSALETVDECLKKLVEKCLENQKTLLITADHGNAEQMKNPQTGEIDKEHTTNPVFFILIDAERKQKDKSAKNEDLLALASLPPTGILADVAPTILDLMEIKKPSLMTGISLIESLS